MATASGPSFSYDRHALEAFCLRWKVQRLVLFGSALSAEFQAHSDIDLLVTFVPEARWTLLDWPQMLDELQAIFARKVDLVEQGSIRNPYRLRNIQARQEVLYAA